MCKISIRWLGIITLVLCLSSAQAAPKKKAFSSTEGAGTETDSSEDWKGKSDQSEVGVSFMTGLGIVHDQAGFALIPGISKKIISRGFVADLNDSVWIETEMGPVISRGTAYFSYSAHLRWDFQKSPEWIFYGLGGFAGHTDLGLFPRFGVGAIWNMSELLQIRTEISHEYVMLGLQLPLYF